MKSERFMHIVVPRRGYSDLSSPDVPALSRDRRTTLRNPMANDARTFEEGLGVTVWDTQPASNGWWAVCTYLKKGVDEHQRPLVSSHSCFLPSDQYARYASSFDTSILEPLRDELKVPESIDDGTVEPLELREPSTKGIALQQYELKLLAELTSISDPRAASKSFLPQLLACFLADKGFVLRVKEAEDAIGLAVVLLKIAAVARLEKPPRIATFTPRSDAAALYACQIRPDPRVRGDSEFFSNWTPDETTRAMAGRLAAAVQIQKVGDLESAFDVAYGIADVDQKLRAAVPARGASQDEKDQRDRDHGSDVPDLAGTASAETFAEWRQSLLIFEKKLRTRKDRLDAQEAELERLNGQLKATDGNLQAREDALVAREKHLNSRARQLDREQSQSSFWDAYAKVDELLHGKYVDDLKDESISALHKLLDRPKKDVKAKLLDLLDNELLETNVRTIQETGSGNGRLDLGKAIRDLKNEKEKRDKKSGNSNQRAWTDSRDTVDRAATLLTGGRSARGRRSAFAVDGLQNFKPREQGLP